MAKERLGTCWLQSGAFTMTHCRTNWWRKGSSALVGPSFLIFTPLVVTAILCSELWLAHTLMPRPAQSPSGPGFFTALVSR